MAIFELWDMDTRNLVGTYETQEAALDIVRKTVRRHGHKHAESLALGTEDSRGNVRPIAAGQVLTDLASAAVVSRRVALAPEPAPPPSDGRAGAATGMHRRLAGAAGKAVKVASSGRKADDVSHTTASGRSPTRKNRATDPKPPSARRAKSPKGKPRQ
jgi:hypothetical protein